MQPTENDEVLEESAEGLMEASEDSPADDLPATLDEEEDPGELVSLWHRMKKNYEKALESLDTAASQLNALSAELESRYGIRVPKVREASVSAQPQADERYEPPASETPGSPSAQGEWRPPLQAPVEVQAPSTSSFVDELRRDAATDPDANFAASIAGKLKGFGFGG